MGADRGTARSEDYSPQSSSAFGARASATGTVSFTSSSAPQSGQDTISPLTASEPTVTSASHSGHFATFPSSQDLRGKPSESVGLRRGNDACRPGARLV